MEVLPPASSGEFISKHACRVKLSEEGIEKLSIKIISSIKDNELQLPELDTNDLKLPVDYAKAIDWVFMVDSLNFCFWSLPGRRKWHIGKHSGYHALEAALIKAVKNNIDITNPHFYSKMTLEQLSDILNGDNDSQIPLLKERLANLHEVGNILTQKFCGTFETCVNLAAGSAMKLLQIIIDNFPCFRDEVIYKGRKVSFYKRAQLVVADIWNLFKGKSFGQFHDVNKLTMFADYRVPQVLVYFGVLKYDEELLSRLKNDNGCEEEVEIRGCSIHAVELLKRSVEEKLKDSNRNITPPNSTLIDYYLWCYRRKYEKQLRAVPFHKTMCIYY